MFLSHVNSIQETVIRINQRFQYLVPSTLNIKSTLLLHTLLLHTFETTSQILNYKTLPKPKAERLHMSKPSYHYSFT